MLFQELSDWITPMPTSSINIQPNLIAAKLAIEVLQHIEKAFPISAFCLDHSSTTQERCYPAGNIQSLLMLTGCRNLQSFADERPTTAKPRMHSKAAFVLKNNGFFRTQRFEFFLSSWRMSSRLLPLLVDRHDWPASTDIRVDASNTGPDELSVLCQTGAANGSLMWGHPSERDSNQTSEAILPDAVPTGLRFSASSGPGVRSVFSELELRHRPYSPPVSSDSRSFESGPELRKSSRAAALPVPEGGWRSLCQSRLPELFQQGPRAALLMLYEGSMGRYSCLQYNITVDKL